MRQDSEACPRLRSRLLYLAITNSDKKTSGCQALTMGIDEWWPSLSDETRAWLIANNGDALPSDVVNEIASAGGAATSVALWVGKDGPAGFYLSDRATDWIEEIANNEH